MNKFHGTGVALVTPFNTDGSVAFNKLQKLIDHTINGGVDYLVSLGTTGETATLSIIERTEVWNFTSEAVAGRIPLVAGVGGNNTSELTQQVKNMNGNQFDAILSVSPYYNKPTQEGIYQHYKAVSEASDLPLILYNVPGRTGSNIASETTLRLAHDFKNIIGIKEASGDFDQFNKIMKDKPADFLFISGDDPIALQMISMGAVGIISVIGNAFPSILSKMIQMCLDGNFSEARFSHYSLIEVTRHIFAEGNPAGVKATLKLLGICGDTVRLPLVNITEETFESIAQELNKLNLI
ncbi:MAG: 4-hydroxy-tetrahydrodipicolinate synthase [Flavobacterium sp.]|nr:4-hydroxy-tetrahydrodipicolinate synthase [Pedobacter sp.]